MDDLAKTRETLSRQLDEAIAADPLVALTEIGAVQGDIASRRQQAVRAAASDHTWAEIGEALGVSRQAAHQKFAKEWATTLKDEIKAEHKAMKTAIREGAHAHAAAAEAKRDAVVTEFKKANRRGKK